MSGWTWTVLVPVEMSPTLLGAEKAGNNSSGRWLTTTSPLAALHDRVVATDGGLGEIMGVQMGASMAG